MKKCKTCSLFKDLEEFHKDKARSDNRKSDCKSCAKRKAKEWRSNNKERDKLTAIRRNKKNRLRNQEFVHNYLLDHPCVDCGEEDPVVLEFDHQHNKQFLISKLIKSTYSIQSIKEEIDKCEVKCANCHRRKTAKDQKWYSWVRGQTG